MKNTDKLDRTIWIADNLPFLRKLDTESVDLVVIDPPFGKRQTFTGSLKPPLTDAELEHEYDLLTRWGVQNEEDAYDVGIEFPDQLGTTALFRDIWDFRFQVLETDWDWLERVCPAASALIEATRLTHSDSIAGYITFMTLRVLEIHRILKPTGSVYLHCDPTAGHYLKLVMDAVFGEVNFKNQIVWERSAGRSDAKTWARVHDTIMYYVKGKDAVWNRQYQPLRQEYVSAMYRYEDTRGRYRTAPLYGGGVSGGTYTFTWKGVESSEWRFPKNRLDQLDVAGLIHWSSNGLPSRKTYLSDSKGVAVRDVITDMARATPKERTGYPTQKPQALAKRIIEASSNPGDLVLDCFAGCAYVPVAAELLGRRWIACDMSPRAWTVVRRQFEKQPDLCIVTEGIDIGAVQEKLDTAGKVIRVRGPNELPVRTTTEEVKRPFQQLKSMVFRQKPKETSQQIWEAFVTEWGTECWYCGTEKARDRRELQLDHVEPSERDGTNDDCWNRALSCAPCNSDKRNALTPEETIEKAYEAGRISTPARRDEQLGRFNAYMAWARERWEDVQAGRIEDPA